jgi:hypothetical protein
MQFTTVTKFEMEWKELHPVLESLPRDDQRAILGQLMIMANGRTKQGRLKIVNQVANSLAVAALKESVPSEIRQDLSRSIVYVGHFARLKDAERKVFGKLVFAAISQLYRPNIPSPGDADEYSSSSSPSRMEQGDRELILEGSSESSSLSLPDTSFLKENEGGTTHQLDSKAEFNLEGESLKDIDIPAETTPRNE